MKIADYLKKKRLDKGYSDVDFSNLTGLNVSWIGDLESDDDELDTLCVPDIKKICEALSISPADILRAVASDLKHLPLSDLLKKRREEKGYTIEKLSDLIGYEVIVLQSLENNLDLKEVPMPALMNIAIELDLPLELLLEKL